MADLYGDLEARVPVRMTPSGGYTLGETVLGGAQMGARGSSVAGAPVRGAVAANRMELERLNQESMADMARRRLRIEEEALAANPAIQPPVEARPSARLGSYVPASATRIGAQVVTQDGYPFTKVAENLWEMGDGTRGAGAEVLTNEMVDELTRPDPELGRHLRGFVGDVTPSSGGLYTPDDLEDLLYDSERIRRAHGPGLANQAPVPSRLSRIASGLKTGIKGALTPANILKDATYGTVVGGLSAGLGHVAGRPTSAGRLSLPPDSAILDEIDSGGSIDQATLLRAVEAAGRKKEALRQNYIDEINARQWHGYPDNKVTVAPGARIEEISDYLGPVRWP